MSIDRLSAEDRVMLEADSLWPQDVGALVLLDGAALLDGEDRPWLDLVLRAMASRIHLVPRFRQVIHVPRRGLGGPFWVDAPDFDLRRHLQIASLEVTSEQQLLEAIEQLRRKPLDRSQPLWEAWLLSGLPDRKLGLFVRFHHAMADGRAAMTMLGAFLDVRADASVAAGVARPWRPARRPKAAALMVDNVAGRVRGLVAAAARLTRPREIVSSLRSARAQAAELLGEGPASRTSLNRLVGPNRRFALVRASLPEVREIGRAHGATPNDVLLAVTTAGLRTVLTRRGEAVRRLRLRAYSPVSLRRGVKGTAHGNLISQMVVHLPVNEVNPSRRLSSIALETARTKSAPRASMGTLFRLSIVRRLLLKAFARQRVNTVVTTVHGPRRPVYLAGAPALEIFPELNLFGNQTLGVGALTFAGQFCIGVTVDGETYPDIDVLAEAMRDDLAALLDAARSRGYDAAHALAAAGDSRPSSHQSWLPLAPGPDPPPEHARRLRRSRGGARVGRSSDQGRNGMGTHDRSRSRGHA